MAYSEEIASEEENKLLKRLAAFIRRWLSVGTKPDEQKDAIKAALEW